MNNISIAKINPLISTTTLDDKTKSKQNDKQDITSKASINSSVVYEPSKDISSLRNYDNQGHVYNKSAIDGLKADSDAKLSELKNTVKAMLEKQGYTFQDVMDILDGKDTETKIKIDDETKAKAQESISEDGYFGVKNTSNRIIEFAKIISGDDPSKLETLKQGISDGFEAAKKAFGGELPEISQQTYDAVMKGLDDWAGKNK